MEGRCRRLAISSFLSFSPRKVQVTAVFRIKICGITSVEDARAAIAAGTDAVGLNFYEKSSRYLAIDKAKEISAVCNEMTRVGVFVNASAEAIHDAVEQVGLDAIQLHGDEPPAFLAELNADLPVIRARRLDAPGLASIAMDLQECEIQGSRRPEAVLLDAASAGQYGGTGHQLPWNDLSDYASYLGETPMILAGGLRPENVAEAIRIVHPNGVDVASGVESEPGVKCPEKMRLFVEAAKSSFESL